MKQIATRIVLAAALSVMGLCVTPASAAFLSIDVNPTLVQGAPGQDVQIDFTLTNITTDLFIDNISINSVTLDPGLLGFLDTSTFDNQGLRLAPGGSLNAFALFSFAPGAPLNEFESFTVEFAFDTFDTFDAGDPVDEALTEQTGFRARAVPEPTLLLMLGMAAGTAAFARRRRN